MSEALARRIERRSRQRAANRGAILEAARRVAAREGAGELSLRAVAAEAGYAPASVYEYFRNRAELVLALGAEDMGSLARALREAGGQASGTVGVSVAAKIVLDLIRTSRALPAAASTLEGGDAPPEAERLFNGRLIAALTAFAEALGRTPAKSRDDQLDVVLAAAAVTGLAVLARAGRLKTFGLEEDALVERLDRRFVSPPGS
jgi:AcrR family transcriptional regulator